MTTAFVVKLADIYMFCILYPSEWSNTKSTRSAADDADDVKNCFTLSAPPVVRDFNLWIKVLLVSAINRTIVPEAMFAIETVATLAVPFKETPVIGIILPGTLGAPPDTSTNVHVVEVKGLNVSLVWEVNCAVPTEPTVVTVAVDYLL